MIFHALDETMLVAGQIGPGEVAEAAARGVTLIVNNRPDGEEPGQPDGAAIEAAARAAGLAYRHLPVAGGIMPGQAEAMADLLDEAQGKVLAFCRSGTRSTWLWALARSLRGADGEAIIARAAAAGYDLSPLRAYVAPPPIS
jgi:uncharacterized protein (TIGR01244 family)